MTGPNLVDVEKRHLEDDGGASVSTLSSKKRKVERDLEAEKQIATEEKVDPSELASAFALASLAALSPPAIKSIKFSLSEEKNATVDKASRQIVENSTSWEETRSPKATQAPSTPDQRSTGSPGSPQSHESAKSQDIGDERISPDGNRRVHFAPSTKDHQAQSNPSILKSNRQIPPPSRRIVMPMPHPAPVAFDNRARAQMPYVLGAAAFRSPPPVPHRHPLHSPHAAYHHAPQPWFHGAVAPAAMASRMPYPQRLMQPPLLHPENQWICDFCNVASFATYEEACAHEETCKIRMAKGMHMASPQSLHSSSSLPSRHGQSHPMSPGSLMSRSSSGEDEVTDGFVSAASDKWHSGSMSLSMEESDREWLSELNCYIRNHCVEAFSATEEDVTRSSKRGRITLQQVGIRCRFCKHVPAKEKAVAAVSFPTSIGGIYESVKRWQRVHVEICDAVPQETRNMLTALSSTNVWVPTTRQYWTDSAKTMGLVDTNEGIRFGIDPKQVSVRVASSERALKLKAKPLEALSANENKSSVSATSTLAEGASTTDQGGDSAAYVVFPNDTEMIPPYVYFLMRQVEPCRFTEADRFVARSKGPVGYPGFQCRHCNGHAGLGKYFPVSAKSLSTNSTSQNIHAHLLKCRKCPEQIKDRLVQLKIEKGRSPRLEPGWRKVFFDKVWGRLHG